MNASDADVAKPIPSDLPSLDSSIEYRPSPSEVIENDEFTVDPNILAQEALFDNNVYFHIDENEEEGEVGYSNRPRSGDMEAEIAGLPLQFERLGGVRELPGHQRSSQRIIQVLRSFFTFSCFILNVFFALDKSRCTKYDGHAWDGEGERQTRSNLIPPLYPH